MPKVDLTYVTEYRPGCWRVRIPHGPTEVLAKGMTRSAMARRRDELLAAVRSPGYVAPTSETVAQAARALATHRAPRQRATTRRAWDSRIRRRIEGDPIGALVLTKVTDADCDAWLGRLASSGIGPGTQLDSVTLLRAVFARAVQRRIIAWSPAEDLATPTRPVKAATAITVADVRAIAAAMPARNKAMPTVAALTGARPSELLALRVQDVDLDPDHLNPQVRITAQLEPGTTNRTTTKTRSSVRAVPLAPLARSAIREHLATFPAGADGTIFTTRFGQPYRADYYGKIFAAAVTAAKVPHCTPHALRHHFVSVLHDQGITDSTVAAWVGHASTSLIQRTYQHPLAGTEGRTRDALAAAWEPVVLADVSPLRHKRDA